MTAKNSLPDMKHPPANGTPPDQPARLSPKRWVAFTQDHRKIPAADLSSDDAPPYWLIAEGSFRV